MMPFPGRGSPTAETLHRSASNMATSNLSTHKLIKADGTKEYRDAVLDHLRTIRATQDGRLLLDQLQTAGFPVVITDTDKGNACGFVDWREAVPPMTRAIFQKNDALFQTELTKALNTAKGRGVPLEHYARQLANGLTPATYTGATNVVRPTMAWTSALPTKATATQTMAKADEMMVKAKTMLENLTTGSLKLSELPESWKFNVPRLLREHMDAGKGTGSKVSFNATKTFHCVNDPAMHQRPPAIGLAHELIHALHNSQGKGLGCVIQNNQNLEEVVTTGMAPYQYEPISDNKMRTQWPTRLELRHNY